MIREPAAKRPRIDDPVKDTGSMGLRTVVPATLENVPFEMLREFMKFLEVAELATMKQINQRFCACANKVMPTLLLTMLTSTDVERFPAKIRAKAGNELARIGDPRFDSSHYYLPADRTDGFVRIPGGEEVAPFQMSRYPVTVAQYKAFELSGGYLEDRYWEEAQQVECWSKAGFKGFENNFRQEHGKSVSWNKNGSYGALFEIGNHPVVGVSWYEAKAYSTWLSEQLRYKVDLPTKKQWWHAARGRLNGMKCPLGNEAKTERMNVDETGLRCTSSVGCFAKGKNGYGIEDLCGNVWEWCEDVPIEDDSVRACCGGCWVDDAWKVDCGYFEDFDAMDQDLSGGFRLIRPFSISM